MPAGISETGDNSSVCGTPGAPDAVYYDVRREPFELYGFYEPRSLPRFVRIPEDVASATSEDVSVLNASTSGGRVRFSTDSPYIAISAQMRLSPMTQMPLTGSSGFDIYEDAHGRSAYRASFIPPLTEERGWCSLWNAGSVGKLRSYTINFPLYDGVDSLFIGLAAGSKLSGGMKYSAMPPVTYYGSSITQGGCASRPGNSYQGIVSRRLNVDFRNLGFSGSACGEDAVVNYMCGLDQSLFVCDYDYNAPSTAHLEATHGKLYSALRDARPDMPIIFLTAPTIGYQPDNIERRAVIWNTYISAVRAGDKRVAFLDGYSLFADDDIYTVDGVHPNDAGFAKMAKSVGAVIERFLFV